MKVLYSWLKEYVGENIPSVSKIEDLMTFHAFEIEGHEEAEDETVIDVKVLPDRSSDCLSHRGIAREIAALIAKPLACDPLRNPQELAPLTNNIKVTIENPENCRRFGAALVTGVNIKESPEWLKKRLKALGQRPINNVVDATNYVMQAIGQPLHAYDAGKISQKDGVWHYGVRLARGGEEITTLSNEKFTLKNTIQLIVDENDQALLGIAGIKGGKQAEVDQDTASIIIEAANFNPQLTRKAAQILRLQTDASRRFENNVSPEMVPYALQEVVKLILEIGGGTCEGYADVFPKPAANPEVTVSLSRINALLGISISVEAVEDILSRLGFEYERQEEKWSVTAPFERTDVLIAEDVIADIGRVYGYEHVKSAMPLRAPLTELNARHYYSEKVRGTLIGEGFSEVITSSFRKKDTIQLQNALASDKSCMRSSLRENLKEVLDRNMPNADLLGISSVQVFEIGTIFYKTDDNSDVTEHTSLALGVRMKKQGYTKEDDARLEEVIAKVEGKLSVTLKADIRGGIAECNFTRILRELPTPSQYDLFVPGKDTVFRPYSVYPFISRDIALWVPDETMRPEAEEMIRENGGNLLVRLSLFDEFKKGGKTSLAWRLVFQSKARTLTDEEVENIMEIIYTEAKNRGYTVR
jgi:phenylalanyl-tRNA synthetase beta chain